MFLKITTIREYVHRNVRKQVTTAKKYVTLETKQVVLKLCNFSFFFSLRFWNFLECSKINIIKCLKCCCFIPISIHKQMFFSESSNQLIKKVIKYTVNTL